MSIAPKSVEDLIKDMKLYRDNKDKYGMGIVMTGRVEKMTDQDIKAMAEYVHSLKK
jgi:cytochrome c553